MTTTSKVSLLVPRAYALAAQPWFGAFIKDDGVDCLFLCDRAELALWEGLARRDSEDAVLVLDRVRFAREVWQDA